MKTILFFLLLISNSLFAYKQIEITAIKRYATYTEATIVMRFAVPAVLMNGAVPFKNATAIAATYGNYSVDSIGGNPVYVITYTETYSFVPTTLANFKSGLQARWTAMNTQVQAMVLKPYDILIGAYYDGTTWTTQ